MLNQISPRRSAGEGALRGADLLNDPSELAPAGDTSEERHRQGIQGPLRPAPPGGPFDRSAHRAEDLAAVHRHDGVGESAQVFQLQHPGARLHRRRRWALFCPHRLRHSQ